MSLSINRQKVNEQMERICTVQMMVPVNVEQVEIAMPSAEIHGTLSVVPPEFDKARSRLLLLRRKLAERGEKFLSSEELDKENGDTRGR